MAMHSFKNLSTPLLIASTKYMTVQEISRFLATNKGLHKNKDLQRGAFRDLFSRATPEAEPMQLQWLCNWSKNPADLVQESEHSLLALNEFCKKPRKIEHFMLALCCMAHIYRHQNNLIMLKNILQQLIEIGRYRPVLLNASLRNIALGAGIKNLAEKHHTEFLLKSTGDNLKLTQCCIAFRCSETNLADVYIQHIRNNTDKILFYEILKNLAAVISPAMCLKLLKDLQKEIKPEQQNICTREYCALFDAYRALACRLSPKEFKQIWDQLLQLINLRLSDKTRVTNYGKIHFAYHVLTSLPLAKLADEKLVTTMGDLAISNVRELQKHRNKVISDRDIEIWSAIAIQRQDGHLHLEMLVQKLAAFGSFYLCNHGEKIIILLKILFEQYSVHKNATEFLHQQLEHFQNNHSYNDQNEINWVVCLLIHGGFKWIDQSKLWQLIKPILEQFCNSISFSEAYMISPFFNFKIFESIIPKLKPAEAKQCLALLKQRDNKNVYDVQIASCLVKNLQPDEVFRELFLPSLQKFAKDIAIGCSYSNAGFELAANFIRQCGALCSLKLKQQCAQLFFAILIHVSPNFQNGPELKCCLLVCEALVALNVWEGNGHHLETCKQYLLKFAEGSVYQMGCDATLALTQLMHHGAITLSQAECKEHLIWTNSESKVTTNQHIITLRALSCFDTSTSPKDIRQRLLDPLLSYQEGLYDESPIVHAYRNTFPADCYVATAESKNAVELKAESPSELKEVEVFMKELSANHTDERAAHNTKHTKRPNCSL